MENEILNIENTEIESTPAASEYSEADITSRIASLLGDDLSVTPPAPEAIEPVNVPDTSELPAPALPDDYKVKIKVNGVEQEVPLSELKNGYQRQQDYTQKTQELSQQRQEVESKKSEYDQYLNSIPLLAQVAQTNINDALEKLYSPDFTALANSDPATYIAEKAKLESVIAHNQRAHGQMVEQYQQHQSELQKAQNEAMQLQIQNTFDVLANEIPGWKDGTLVDDIGKYANALNLSQEDMRTVLLNPTYVHVLNKARMYDELMAKQDIASKKVQNVPSRVLQPENETTTERDNFNKRKAAALRSGDDRTIAALLAELL